MKFNDRQKEGVARFFDTLSASSTIGAVVGLTGHSVTSPIEMALLITNTIVLLVFSILLRK